jgi:hypothetical protein
MSAVGFGLNKAWPTWLRMMMGGGPAGVGFGTLPRRSCGVLLQPLDKTSYRTLCFWTSGLTGLTLWATR